MSYFLAGDIGGTKTRLAVALVDGEKVKIEHEADYASRDYSTFEELLNDFMSTLSKVFPSSSALNANHKVAVDYAALGIAGPVQGRVVQTTNLPWRIDVDALQNRFGFSCTLLNDLEATAYGLLALGEQDLCTLQTGAQNARGNVAVIAAGTGLGEAGLYWNGSQHQPFATEGGHTSFSPSTEMDFALLRYLQQQRSHVSWERIVSGMGLLSMYDFLNLYYSAQTPTWLAEQMRTVDAAAAIASAALAESDDICIETLAWFVRLYGEEAGNLALKLMSRGGMYLGGGIAPKILPLLQTGAFIDAFLNKGRMRPLLEAMPVQVILNDKAALLGAALQAEQLASQSS